MKNAILGCCLFLSGLFFLLTCTMQFEVQLKDRELHSIANISMQNAITYMYNVENVTSNEIVTVMKETISSRIMKGADIKLDVHIFDAANGVLSVSFTSTWNQMNGKKKVIKVRRNMIIDQKKGTAT